MCSALGSDLMCFLKQSHGIKIGYTWILNASLLIHSSFPKSIFLPSTRVRSWVELSVQVLSYVFDIWRAGTKQGISVCRRHKVTNGWRIPDVKFHYQTFCDGEYSDTTVAINGLHYLYHYATVVKNLIIV